jgi:hypothetical protein
MLQLNHRMLALLSGAVWMAVGCFLLPLGLKLLVVSPQGPLLNSLGGGEQVALLLVALGLCIGYMKGRYVLGKTAAKGIEHIKSLPNPSSIAKIYGPKYLILLGGMVALGISIKYFGVPNDIRGLVDVAVGTALIQGAAVYFRFALTYGRAIP